MVNNTSSIFNFKNKELRLLIFKLLLIIPVIFPFAFLCLTPMKQEYNNFIANHYMGAYKDKINHLKTIPSPKIIIVGGSSPAFGIDSEMIEKSCHKRTMNVSLHAELGLKFILTSIKKYISPYDIIILSPEYGHFYGDFLNGREPLARLIINHAPDEFEYIDFKTKLQLIPYLPSITLEKLSKYFYMLLKIGQPSLNIYQRRSFNSHGDITGNTVANKRTNDQFAFDLTNNQNYNKSTIEFLNNYATSFEGQNVKLYFDFPPVSFAAYLQSQKKIEELNIELENRLIKWEMISHPKEKAFDSSVFFDTTYHLTSEARKWHTEMLIKKIKTNC